MPLLALLLTSGCAPSGSHPADALNDAQADASGETKTASDAGDAAGYETVGAYRCCAPDTGTSCCDGTKPGTCFRNGGVYGKCIDEGNTYDAKVICARCCDGLERIGTEAPGDHVPPDVDGLPDGCDSAAIPSDFICARCGDGVCGAGETFCNCPSDCTK